MTESEKELFRPFPSFPPSVWGAAFASLPSQDSEYEAYTNEVEQLKENVEQMLMQSTGNLISSVELINMLCCLGVSYHFESQIDGHLNFIFNSVQILCEKSNFDIHTVGVLFRVLRQHGYKIDCDVFNKFTNSDGEFHEDIGDDVKGLLSLYEASFLCVHNEDILDKALEFSKKHLQTFVDISNSNSHLINHIRKSLEQPFHHGVQRLEAFHYISFYEQEESRNETLLRFAKLDYNRLQLLYRKELSLVSRWWNDLNIQKALPYARDRIVEGYFWAVGTVLRPESSLARLLCTKCLKIISIVDDTFDTYGELDELELFTHALERWTLDSTGELPNYMKFIYRIIMDTYGEMQNHQEEGILTRASYAKEMFLELVRCYLVEANWIHGDDNVPPFHDYVKNGLTTSTWGAICSGMMTGIEELDIKDYLSIRSNPKIVEATKLFGRLVNDIKPHQVEIARKDIPIGMKSYMNEYNVSKEEAIIGIKKICVNAWKEINEACMKPTVDSKIILDLSLNFARVNDFSYKVRDTYTYGSDMKDVVESLFIRPLQI